jgi:hypothetical protein
MRAKTGGFERSDDEILIYDLPDEALEIAAGSGNESAAANTIANCTGLSECFGPACSFAD